MVEDLQVQMVDHICFGRREGIHREEEDPLDHLGHREGDMVGIHQEDQSSLQVLLDSRMAGSHLGLEGSCLVVDHHRNQDLMEDHQTGSLMGVLQMGSQELNMGGSLGN